MGQIGDFDALISQSTTNLQGEGDVRAYTVSKDGKETFSDNFREQLRALNEIVISSDYKLEGNLFYFHHAAIAADMLPDPGRAHKRRNYDMAMRHKQNVLEIGFNAGHSALLALNSNPTLRYTAVDIARNRYTPKCAEIMKKMFGDRFNIYIGDSRDILPNIAMTEQRFDLLHVDGGHGDQNCRTDISNCLRIAASGPGKHLLLDDTNASGIFDVYLEFVAAGRLVTESMGGRWDNRENLLALIR